MTPDQLEEINHALAQPLDPQHIRKKQDKFDYIQTYHAEAEANKVFGPLGWSSELIRSTQIQAVPRSEVDGKTGFCAIYSAVVEITVDKTKRQGVGHGESYQPTLGGAIEKAEKTAFSDAEKRALKSFGWRFGLALYETPPKGGQRTHVGKPQPMLSEQRNAYLEKIDPLLEYFYEGGDVPKAFLRIHQKYGEIRKIAPHRRQAAYKDLKAVYDLCINQEAAEEGTQPLNTDTSL